jgi:outer membrane protein assembly factor BamB
MSKVLIQIHRSLWTQRLLMALVFVLAAVSAAGAEDAIKAKPPVFMGVFTYHYDNARSGVNPFETVLTRTNVTSNTFGKLFSYPVDGYVYGEPLYVPNVLIPKLGPRNVVYIVTEHDSVYAFDADGISSDPLWQVSFINPAAGITTVPSADTDSTDLVPEVGITSTPVIDPSGTIYVVAKTKENGNYFQRIHALNIATGQERAFSPRVINPAIAGTGAGHVQGVIPFNALREHQRSALLEVKGKIYVTFASHGDNPPYHGWVLGYSAKTLKPSMVFNDTPNGSDGGIWQGGNGIAADTAGAIYCVSGNGTFDANTGGLDYGDSAIKLSAATLLHKLVRRPSDYFTPSNQRDLSFEDADMGTMGAVLFPDQTVGPKHLMVTADKSGTIYLLNRDSLGHFNAAGETQIVQELPEFLGGVDSTFTPPAIFNGKAYFGAYNHPVIALPIVDGLFSPAGQLSTTGGPFDYPGVVPSISAQGTANSILWVLDVRSYIPGAVLIAYNADTLNLLYYSEQVNGRDRAGGGVKFTTPMVANGKVYVGTKTELDVYGLLPQ